MKAQPSRTSPDTSRPGRAARANITAFVDALRLRGVTVELHGDGFRVLPPSAVTQDEVHTLRRYEPTVRRILIADDTSIAFRTAYYQRQMKVWAATGAFGVPFLAFPLPRVKIRPGLCVGCGIALAAGRTWRCFLCEEALRVALGLPREGA